MPLKRLILLAAICLVLTGCRSTTKKIEEITLDYLEESYHITDAEVLSIEPSDQYGSIVVVILDRIFAGKTYDVRVKVNDSVSTIMEGKVNKRELIFRNDNYVSAKHEKLKEESEIYLHLLKDLENIGILLKDIDEGIDYELYHQDIRLLSYVLDAKTTEFDSEEVVQYLQNLSTHILENIDTTIEINLQLPLLFYEQGEFIEEMNEIKFTHANEKKFVEKLNRQMLHAYLTTQVNENLRTEIEWLNMGLSSSWLAEIYHSKQDNFFQHEISLNALEGYDHNRLLDVINLLREEGFDETYVAVYFSNGYTEKCQVKQVKILEDVSRCYEQVYGF